VVVAVAGVAGRDQLLLEEVFSFMAPVAAAVEVLVRR
jgi:hypothetical protein